MVVPFLFKKDKLKENSGNWHNARLVAYIGKSLLENWTLKRKCWITMKNVAVGVYYYNKLYR